MGYLHIGNLYKEQTILLFKECYAMEKVHGTSAHITWKDNNLTFFSGGEKHDRFVSLFDQEKLREEFEQRFSGFSVVVYGEAYGGRQQGMSHTYGQELRFIVFDIQINDLWLNVPKMDKVATDLGFEVVPWVKLSTDIEILNAERDKPSEVAVRRGMGHDKMREGIVVRPIEEMTMNNGERVMAKHKGEKFSERTTQPKVVSPDKLAVLAAADAIAEEWVTPMRLQHVLDKLPKIYLSDDQKFAWDESYSTEDIPRVIAAMIEDVFREAKGEIVESKEARTAIGKRTVLLFKKHLNER